MNNIKLLAVANPLPIYRGFYDQEKSWEENYTQVNMKHCCSCNISKYREIKNGEQYVVLEISLN